MPGAKPSRQDADGQGLVKPVVDQRLPMRELPAAYARMGSRQVLGKVLLVNA